MKRKKLTGLLLAGIMAVSIIACGTAEGNGETAGTNGTTETAGTGDSGEVYTVKWVLPGNEPEDLPEIEDALNKKLADDGMNLQVDIVRIPWDAWEQKTNLMLTTGEEFGLLHIMQDQGSVMSRGILYDLREYLDKYPDLKGRFDEQAWSEVTTKDGQIVAVPAQWQVMQPLGQLSIRKDVLDKLDIPLPRTSDEVMEAAVKIKDYVEKETGQQAYYWTQSTKYPAEWLERTYDTYPFYVDRVNNLWKVDQEGKVTSWFESEEFKKDAQYYREMYKNGLISPDLLTKNEVWEVQNKGTVIMGDCYNWGTIKGLRDAGYPDADLEFYYLNEDATRVLPLTIGNMNGIPQSCTNPEAVVKFLDWFYADASNVQMVVYGIEGKHYNKVEGDEKKIEIIKDDAGMALYQFDNWEVGYYPYSLFDTEEPEESIIQQTTPLEEGTFVTSPIAGFIFNEEPVITEMANLTNEVVSSMYPIKFGFVDYEEAYDGAIAKLKAAGLDKVLEEYQKQLNEYLGK